MKVLVCGSRKYFNKSHVFQVLDTIHMVDTIDVIIEGGATGADTMGYDWAIKNQLDSYRCRAKWDAEGKSAGHVRNSRMLGVMGFPDAFVAFPGGRGTDGMVSLVEKVNEFHGYELIDVFDERDLSL